MSTPTSNHADPIQGALMECLSAQSALSMEPAPVEGAQGNFLTDVDGWAGHAYDHLRMVVKLLDTAYKERERMQHKIFQLEVALREVRNPHEQAQKEA